MKIQSMRLENYRCFSDLSINFDERLTVLVGVNGAGKTAVLDGLAVFLKACSCCYINSGIRFHFLSLSDRKINSDFLSLTCKLSEAEADTFNIHIRNFEKYFDDNFKFYDSVANVVKKYRGEDILGLPIFVYYTSKRILDDFSNTDLFLQHLLTKQAAYEKAFEAQIDFSSSLAWFINKASQEALEVQRSKNLNYTIPELSTVRKAVAMALGDYDEPYVGETPPKLFITPKGRPDQEALQIEQLSDGYRTMLALVMDLARRMAQANEKFDWPEGQGVLHSPAVVLIDEVELHLHPSWQQRVLPSLMEIFPNAQFIVSTHSPQILSSIAAKHIRILKDGEVHGLNEQSKGAEAGRLLEDILGVNQRPLGEYYKDKDAEKLVEYAAKVHSDQWDSEDTQKLRQELENFYGDSEPMLQELALDIESKKWDRDHETGA